MILHIKFTDNSNPWVSFASDKETINKQWRRWMKYHPDTARPRASSGRYYCIPLFGGYMVQNENKPAESTRYYKKLGNALRALEKLGGAAN